jgi:hypothetical protein
MAFIVPARWLSIVPARWLFWRRGPLAFWRPGAELAAYLPLVESLNRLTW